MTFQRRGYSRPRRPRPGAVDPYELMFGRRDRRDERPRVTCAYCGRAVATAAEGVLTLCTLAVEEPPRPAWERGAPTLGECVRVSEVLFDRIHEIDERRFASEVRADLEPPADVAGSFVPRAFVRHPKCPPDIGYAIPLDRLLGEGLHGLGGWETHLGEKQWFVWEYRLALQEVFRVAASAFGEG